MKPKHGSWWTGKCVHGKVSGWGGEICGGGWERKVNPVDRKGKKYIKDGERKNVDG